MTIQSKAFNQAMLTRHCRLSRDPNARARQPLRHQLRHETNQRNMVTSLLDYGQVLTQSEPQYPLVALALVTLQDPVHGCASAV